MGSERSNEVAEVERGERGPTQVDAPRAPSTMAYRLAVLRHYKPVFGYASAILGSTADAEDVTQEPFLRFGERGGDVRQVREWLLRVARNLSFDRFRAGSRLTSVEPDVIESVPGGEEPEQQALRSELGDRLLRLIRRLDEPQRSLVVLFDVQGLKGRECAQILDISENQVKVYLHRARRRLRTYMEEDNG